jgi:hypothetical protein
LVQGNHGLAGFGHGMQQICAGRRPVERKNGEQTVADEFQYSPPCRAIGSDIASK